MKLDESFRPMSLASVRSFRTAAERHGPAAAVWISAGLLALLASSAFAQDTELEPNQPPPDIGEVQIPLSPLPRTVELGTYQVTIRDPENPEDSQLGGSGGPILELIVAGPGLEAGSVTSIQAIWVYGKDLGSRPPEFVLWSKTGVSSPVRCGLKFTATEYCVSECQDFEIGEDGMKPVGKPRPQPPC